MHVFIFIVLCESLGRFFFSNNFKNINYPRVLPIFFFTKIGQR